MKILGISALYHDSAISYVSNGEIIEAVQEERFSRVKHDASFPDKSINYILKKYSLKIEDFNAIVFFDKPFLKFERLLETFLTMAPRGFRTFKMAMPIWLNEKLFLKSYLTKYFKKHSKSFDKNKLFFSEHHLSHASSAFFPSPFKDADILTLDGVGEWATSTISYGLQNKIEIKKEIHFPHSLGLLYSAFTYYTGFKVNSGEYKLMGLAPYGNNKYSKKILENLIDVKNDGSFRLNIDFFDYVTGLKMTNDKFHKLFGHQARISEKENITQFHMDIASSIQDVLEQVVIKITRSMKKNNSSKNLCLAGGVALNCVANGKILKESGYENIWIQPAAGDAGGAVGAALAYWFHEKSKKRNINKNDSMKGSYIGSEYKNEFIKKKLEEKKMKYHFYNNNQLIKVLTENLKKKKIIGLFQGRMEFGPRALGNRSIIADPRDSKMQKKLNLKIKFRESFRPFAPAIIREHLNKWFDLDYDSPYMLLVEKIKKSKRIKFNTQLFGIDLLNEKRSSVPAVTHVDYTSRIQTVHKSTNLFFYNLIQEFYKVTKCPILVNTSFNIRGEPIVESPNDAIRCFLGTELDVLCLGNYLLYKNEQDKNKLTSYKSDFALD